MRIRIIQTDYKQKTIYAIQYKNPFKKSWHFCDFGVKTKDGLPRLAIFYKFEMAHREAERLRIRNRRKWRGEPDYGKD